MKQMKQIENMYSWAALVVMCLVLASCGDNKKSSSDKSWPQEEILQQLSEQKQEINTLKKELSAIKQQLASAGSPQPTGPKTVKLKSIADPSSMIHNVLSEMSIKLAFSPDNRLSVAPFSQGQKKRLASALALTTNRPICLFDEWTADQDPEFRSYFYHRYLPKLASEGKTILVITHDDRYFDHADIVLRLEAGQIASMEPMKKTATPISVVEN